MYVGFLLTIVSLFLLSGCSHSQKQSAAQNQNAAAPSSAATAAPAVGPQAPAPAPENKAETDLVTCKRDAETRSLEIEALDPKGCKLWYSKDGSRNSVASSVVGKSHCENVQSRIQDKLEEAKFTCASGAPVTETQAKK